MVLEKAQEFLKGAIGTNGIKMVVPHPFDPLSPAEIDAAVKIVATEHVGLFFNTVALWEPRKADMMKWLADQKSEAPHRVADVIAYTRGKGAYEGLVDLTDRKLLQWNKLEGVQPLVRIKVSYLT